MHPPTPGPASGTCTYLLHDPHTRGLIIDPVDAQIERDLAVLRARTCGCAGRWKRTTMPTTSPVPPCWPSTPARARRHLRACGIGTAQVQLADGDVLHFGGEELRALHTLAIRRAA